MGHYNDRYLLNSVEVSSCCAHLKQNCENLEIIRLYTHNNGGKEREIY